jgi:hypothetical protein
VGNTEKAPQEQLPALSTAYDFFNRDTIIRIASKLFIIIANFDSNRDEKVGRRQIPKTVESIGGEEKARSKTKI